MSRSNNNRGEAGHVPPPPAPRKASQNAAHQQPYWPQPDAQQQGYIPPPLPAANHPPQHQTAAHPTYDQGQPGQQGYYFPPQGHQPPGQQPHAQHPGYDAYGQPLRQQPQHQPASGLSSYVPAAQPNHNNQWQQPAEPSLNDPNGYDLGLYAAGQPYPAQAQERMPPDFGQYSAPAGQHSHAQQDYYPAAQPAYPPQQAGYDQGYGRDTYGQPHPDQLRVHQPHAGYDQHGDLQHGHPHQGQALAPATQDQAEADEEFEEDYVEEEEPRRGRRSLMVVAALVGAIGIGGGLAYGYKKFVGPTAGKQIAKIDTVKTPPQGAPTPPERKIAERLPDVVPQASSDAAPSSSDGQEVGGPRKVQLIPITPSGVPGTAVAAAPPVVRGTTINVPGVTLENTAPPPPPVRIPVAAPQPAPVAAAPVRVAVPAPSAEAPEAPKKIVKAPAVKTKANDAFAPGATATASVPPAAKSGGNGYVAVLSSQKSRMDALKVYADLQQKYGDVLSNKPADVQEANLGDKGVYYRAVVGPPGSREAATTLCTQLKTAGYTGCWVTAY